MTLVKSNKSSTKIDTDAVVRYLGNHTDGEFDKKRCEKEYDRMVEHVEEIRNTPVYRWPKEK